jgi:hypothetical protein
MEFLKKISKKFLNKTLYNILVIIYLLNKDFNKNLPKLILSRKYKIYDSKNVYQIAFDIHSDSASIV